MRNVNGLRGKREVEEPGHLLHPKGAQDRARDYNIKSRHFHPFAVSSS